MTYRITETTELRADPLNVFDQISAIGRLPQWNRAITEVVDAPPALESGSNWKVKIHAMGTTWVSRSEARCVDKVGGRFAYRSQSDDGNPSFADWEWRLEPSQGGTRVTTSVVLEPLTFWRRHLLAPLRRPVLRREMRASLAALEQTLATATEPT